jgi:hypothetical protein
VKGMQLPSNETGVKQLSCNMTLAIVQPKELKIVCNIVSDG